LLHFDGKFFTTLKKLFLKPGEVPLQFINGKRVKFLEPFKMYLFTSTILFILLALFNTYGSNENSATHSVKPTKPIIEYEGDTKKDTLPNPNNYASYADFENVLKKAPNFSVTAFSRLFFKKIYHYGKEYDITNLNMDQFVLKELLNKLPKLLFFILPFFTWSLQLLYFRKKQYAFSDHGVFTLYFFVFTFMMIILLNFLIFMFKKFADNNNVGDFVGLTFVGILVYLFLALKKFYEQSWFKTFLKFFLFLTFGLCFIAIAFLFILLISFLFF
jgi:hypothetical protein